VLARGGREQLATKTKPQTFGNTPNVSNKQSLCRSVLSLTFFFLLLTQYKNARAKLQQKPASGIEPLPPRRQPAATAPTARATQMPIKAKKKCQGRHNFNLKTVALWRSYLSVIYNKSNKLGTYQQFCISVNTILQIYD